MLSVAAGSIKAIQCSGEACKMSKTQGQARCCELRSIGPPRVHTVTATKVLIPPRHFAPQPDSFFGNVCELDLVFNFYKVSSRTLPRVQACLMLAHI